VLVYSSEVLEADYEVTGPLVCVLHAATDARDTDFVVKLSDVAPDGFSRILAEGVIRARFRDGYDAEELIEPGAVLEYRVDLVATANTFLAGHRIRVDVTSSSFPRFDRNPNTGRPLGVDGPEDLLIAHQTNIHDTARPSHIVLPVVSS
jgi:putative CocE/NonD family hydrolase